jgi:2-keto-4-pentenoate hydratase/2-oxohepta-3-ene-1,7-dioic acid hydratase in catechol pathway
MTLDAIMRTLITAGLLLAATSTVGMTQTVTKYVRYTSGNSAPALGILDGSTIRELRGDLFENPTPTGRTVPVAQVKLLAPVEPKKVIAVGLNYKSHLGERPAAAYPGLFTKYQTSIIPTETDIVLPSDSKMAHFEGEMVIVIGKRAKNVPMDQAKQYVFGVSVGNDVSERDWQRSDLQWFRAKASDTFGPLGPSIVTGLNYDDLLLQTRVNGKVVQSQRTKDLIFSVAEQVSYISRYVTLEPGDVIYSGTPGTTSQIKAGDVVEVELEGVGILRNRVTQSDVVVASLRVIPETAPAGPMASGGFPIHSPTRPVPPVVNPGPAGPPMPAPSDAIVLFDGTSLSKWRKSDSTNSPAGWKVENGYMEVVRGAGGIRTVDGFGDAHLHVEWASPAVVTGTGQGRGNSGVFLMERYEVQVLDSYNNTTYADGQAAAIYGQNPPMVNASRPPGEWQTFDIIFRAPRFSPTGAVTTPARMTVIHNGIVVQDNYSLLGPTSHTRRDPYERHADKLPISLQDHGNPVRFRNIWIRPLPAP